MSETILRKPKRRTAAEYEALADQLLADMRRLDELMQNDRAEIERLRAESQVITKHTDAILERLEQQIAGWSKAT